VTGQLEILRRLIEGSVSFRLLLATDVHRQTEALGRLLAEIAA
jgi:hypothetical protein